MDENTSKLNSTEILPPKGHQVSNSIGDDEVDQDILAPGTEDEYQSTDEDYCGGDRDT